ncbi:MAG TPA: aldehyde dehydrogenase family protein [Calditrichae bacterium]|nr:aldehyde dehydrogenase family protein [Calditrichia bacterium]
MAIPTYKPFIHNTFTETGNTFEVKNPFTGEPIAIVHRADSNVLDEAVRSAEQGFEEMRRLSSYDRSQILHKIVEGIREREEAFIETIVQESGKPIRFARNEVFRATITFTTAAEEAKRLGGEVLTLDMAPQTRNYRALATRVPLGVVLGISPFNFPLNLVAHKIAPAIAAGNSIILKPASQTPLTALLLAEVIRDAGIPEGGVNIVPASGADAEELVKDVRIRKLTFTGSAAVGWRLKSLSGKKYVTLELGGNAGVIVEPDADLDFAVPRLALGAFAYAGQVCISVQRIYVHQDIWDKFINEFVSEVKNDIQMGDPHNPDVVVGPMISPAEAERIEQWVQEALDAGATLLAGGQRDGAFYAPTVLTNTRPDMKVVREEVFAPVVIVEPYREFTEAVAAVNNSNYGLQAGVFTRDIEKIHYAYRELQVGGVIVNDYPTFRIDPMPYGGSKDSGFGREGIRYAIEEMTEIRLLAMRF